MTRRLMLLTVLIFFMIKGYGQQINQFSVAATSEAIGLPFTNYLPYHPGLEVAGTFKMTEKSNNIQYFNAKLGFFYHEKLETGIYLGGEYQYTQKLFNEKVGLDIPMGLGYLHSFYPSELYVQNDNGDWEAISQTGRGHLYVNLGVGLTYLGSEKVQPFVRQELMLETPFANGIPAIPHSLLKIGVQIRL